MAVASARTRVAIGVLLVAALAPLRFSAGRVAAYLELPRRPDDPISLSEHRLAPLREALLAARVTEVGYLFAPALRDGPAVQRLSDLPYLATRYALVPVMVRPDSERALVVADLAAAPLPPAAIPADLRVAQRFGDGLVLLQRTER
jgi:hypothetical protein